MKKWLKAALSVGALMAAASGALTPVATFAAEASNLPTGTYKEDYRPAYHFTPPQGWMNDPNGLVYDNGQYHLFYQFHPYSTVWGPMHWGHAVSKDLVHWENRPVAIAPDERGTIFSGSAVLDVNNTTGFGTKENPPLVAVFTLYNEAYKATGLAQAQNQGLAYSLDQGRTWVKYKKNPVLKAALGKPDFRDPTVFWFEPTQSWIMPLAVGDHMEFYGSPDMKSWTFLSNFGYKLGAHGGVWECPDLVPMKVAETGETKWVLLQSLNPGGPNGGSATQYFVGDFDGHAFKLDPKFGDQLNGLGPRWVDWGRDNYASVTWSNVPDSDGRVLMIGWMNNWDYADKVPTQVWRGAMTLPRELTLHQTSAGYVLKSAPVRELGALEGDQFAVDPQVISSGLAVEVPPHIVSQSKLDATFATPSEGGKVKIEFSNEVGDVYRFSYDGTTKQYLSDRRKSGITDFSDKFAGAVHTAPRTATSDTLTLSVFMDRDSVEVFADAGETVMTESLYPKAPYTKITVFAEGHPLKIVDLKVSAIDSIH